METNREGDLTEARQSFWRRHGWVNWVAVGLLAVLVGAAVAVEVALHRAEPYLRAHIVQALEKRFHARVELDSFHVSLMNGLWAEGQGLRIWPAQPAAETGDAQTTEPMIRLAEFRFHAPLVYRPGEPIHVSVVELRGLRVDLPPGMHLPHSAQEGAATPGAAVKPKSGWAALLSFDVETLDCSGAELLLESGNLRKLPLDFQIAHLRLTRSGAAGATHPSGEDLSAESAVIGYDAELTNPRPKGTIHATGTLGPWQTADPSQTPINGNYRFDHADLSDFKGIAGILSSTGAFQGTLHNLTVDGAATVPDFRLTHFGSALPLAARFHARVDATTGDTWLEPVDATLGRSHFTAQGQIVRVVAGQPPHGAGHDIALTVNVDRARIEDFLRLLSHSGTVLLTGDVTAKAALDIPPGPAPVEERMTLNGWFALEEARFTSAKMQGRIAELSLRGQGRPEALKTTDPASIPSRMQGGFQLAAGVLALPALEYTVPGAKIDLKGTYGLEGGALNFAGTARMDASVSKMVGGWKGLLLSPADRFFRKDGAGTEVPILIGGTRDAPRFDIDFSRMKLSVKR